jgi:hypothetical protein
MAMASTKEISHKEYGLVYSFVGLSTTSNIV